MLCRIDLSLTVALVLALAGCAHQGGDGAREADAVNRATMTWESFLAKRVVAGDSAPKVEDIMRGRYQDRATCRLGGSGAYISYYRIDDYLLVGFYFDHEDRTTGKPTVGRARRWIKEPDGSLMYYGDSDR